MKIYYDVLCVHALLLILIRCIIRAVLQAIPDFTESFDYHIHKTQHLVFLTPNYSHIIPSFTKRGT